MLSLLIRRFAQMVFVMIGISVLVFLIFFATPGSDPASRIAGRNASPETLAAVRHSFGLDGNAVLCGVGGGEMVEQHRPHGGITGGAALWCMLVDRDEESHGGTPFDQAPYGAVPGMLDVRP